MGKGGYLGGSTIIFPNGRGWSHDPLAPVSRGKKHSKPELGCKSREADTEWLMHFAVSCAACAVLGIGFPPPSVLDERFDVLLGSNGENFHKPFRAKIGSSKGKARIALKAHIDGVALNAQLGQPVPNLPKVLEFCLLHPRFNDAVKKEVKIALTRPNGQDLVHSVLEPPKKKFRQATKDEFVIGVGIERRKAPRTT